MRQVALRGVEGVRLVPESACGVGGAAWAHLAELLVAPPPARPSD
ncbi:hypothetical protein [Nocardioides dilutus]